MKTRLFFLGLALALLLAGCRIVPDQFVSVKPHDDSYTHSTEEVTVNNGTEFRNALRALIREGTEEATLTTDVYAGDLEKDFDQLVFSMLHEEPESAYLVSAIDKEIVQVGSYYKIDLKIQYRHQYSEYKAIEQATTMDTVPKKVMDALVNCDDVLTLHVIDYQDLDFMKMAKEYAEDNLTTVISEPETVQKETYPNKGSDRILVLRFVYPLDYKSLSARKQFVDYMISSAKDSVADEPNDLERARQLFARQIGGHSYSEESADTPAFALFIDRKGDSRVFSAVYEAMCEKAEVNCVTVHGTKDGEPYDWNILELESGVWHVDVNADAQSGAAELRFMTDAEMEGYEWDREAYPACVGLYAPVEPPKNEDAPAGGEQPAEPPEEQPPETEPAPVPPEGNPEELEITP